MRREVQRAELPFKKPQSVLRLAYAAFLELLGTALSLPLGSSIVLSVCAAVVMADTLQRLSLVSIFSFTIPSPTSDRASLSSWSAATTPLSRTTSADSRSSRSRSVWRSLDTPPMLSLRVVRSIASRRRRRNPFSSESACGPASVFFCACRRLGKRNFGFGRFGADDSSALMVPGSYLL